MVAVMGPAMARDVPKHEGRDIEMDWQGLDRFR